MATTKRNSLLVLLLISVAIYSRPGVADNPYSYSGSMSVGEGLARSAYYETQLAFLDLRRQAGNDTGWVVSGAGNVIDSNGNLTALTTGSASAGFLAENPGAVSGDYVLLWDESCVANVEIQSIGAGTWALTLDEAETGRRVYTFEGVSPIEDLNAVVRAHAPVTCDIDWHVIVPNAESLYISGEIFNPEFLEKIRNQKVFRFMDWTNTNNSSIVNIADLASDDSFSWESGAPFYTTMELMKKVSATEAWINIPHAATDATITQIAVEIYTAWESGITIWLEYSNEVWNGIFTQTPYAQAQSLALYGVDGLAGQGLWVAKRSIDIKNIFTTVFGADSDAIKLVVSGQADYDNFYREPDWDSGSNPGGCYNACRLRNGVNYIHDYIDMYAIAPYFTGTLFEDQSLQEARRTDLWTDAQFSADLDASVIEVIGWIDLHSTNLPILTGRTNILFGYYEMGQHMAAQWNANGDYDLAYRAFQDTREMGDLYDRLLTHSLSIGVDIICNFQFVARQSGGFYWGSYETLNDKANFRAMAMEAAYLLPPYTITASPN